MNPIDRKNSLLSRLASKELSMDQFLLECVLWSLETECLVDYEIRQYPMPPREYTEYLDLPFEKRIKIPSEFFHQLSIREYLQMRSRIYALNFAEYSWFRGCKRIIPDTEEYLRQHRILDEKLIYYTRWVDNSTPEIEKAMETFEGQEA